MRRLHDYLTTVDPEQPVAWHDGREKRAGQLIAAAADIARRLAGDAQQRYALFTEDAYPFAALLFGLLHAGKEVWIPGNNLPETARQLQAQHCVLCGDWPGLAAVELQEEGGDGDLAPLAADRPQIVLFTSGSSGQAKAVPKTLRQLQAEVDALEALWGAALANAAALGTVSHQHIYGLLFRVLWPLAAGRLFYSRIHLSPEALVADGSHALRLEPLERFGMHSHAERGNDQNDETAHAASYWVASPAQLKRLDEHSPWSRIAELAMVFSSGGPLPAEAADRIAAKGIRVLEVYGSTETGGIGWRPAGVEPWQTFAGVALTSHSGGTYLTSPYLDAQTALDDRLTLRADGRFLLQGRSDRIVKIEEKRLSLTALEQGLEALPWVSASHAFALTGRRDVVAAVLTLSAAGKALLAEEGRAGLIKRLRAALAERFDAVALPRKWLFAEPVPVNAQGKVDQALLAALMNGDPAAWPRVSALEIGVGGVELALTIPNELGCFPNHFPGFPLLPGVVQIGWAERFGKLFFPIDAPFARMEAVKFNRMIRPRDALRLCLEWRGEAGKLHFQYFNGPDACGSGRFVYAERA